MKRGYWIAVSIALTSTALAISLAACSVTAGQPGYTYGWGPGGMMGPGMMGGRAYSPDAEPLSIDEAADAVRRYLNAYGSNLELKEVMEFAWNFYAEVEEKDTGVHAMELLIDRYTARVYPEMGPNAMWNTKYGMMGRSLPTLATELPVGPKQAEGLAQRYLDKVVPGLTAGSADIFYGYYTLHTFKDGELEGMLSVNGFTGAVWYHNWHGSFIQMRESDGEA